MTGFILITVVLFSVTFLNLEINGSSYQEAIFIGKQGKYFILSIFNNFTLSMEGFDSNIIQGISFSNKHCVVNKRDYFNTAISKMKIKHIAIVYKQLF